MIGLLYKKENIDRVVIFQLNYRMQFYVLRCKKMLLNRANLHTSGLPLVFANSRIHSCNKCLDGTLIEREEEVEMEAGLIRKMEAGLSKQVTESGPSVSRKAVEASWMLLVVVDREPLIRKRRPPC